MIEALNLTKKYRTKTKKSFFAKKDLQIKTAVADLNLKIEPGTIIGLLGINGAGKTTTIKMLTTMLKPTSGSIVIDGIDLIKQPILARKKINLISGGERNLYWRLSAKENLQYFGGLYGLTGSKLSERIEQCLKIVDLQADQDQVVAKFSKGMKQRLQIARGLINDPQYIFLDEPTLGLDVVIAKELRCYLKKLATDSGKGILLTTHYLKEAEELCDYLSVIDQGKLILAGTLAELKAHYAHLYQTQVVLDSDPDELFLSKLHNFSEIIEIDQQDHLLKIVSKSNIVSELCHLSSQAHCNLDQILSTTPDLEDILLNVIKEGNFDHD